MKKYMVIFLILVLAAPAFARGRQLPRFTDYSGGFPERVTIEIPVYDHGFPDWNVTDNYWTRWIQSEFGDRYNVTVNYVAIGKSTEVQDYRQLIASGRAPHIIFHYDMPMAVNYYGEGTLQQLDWEELANYAPTYWANTKEMIERYGAINGERVFIFAERPDADNFTTLIRKDWVERAGYRVQDLTSLETFNQMLVRWRDLGLGVFGARLEMNSFTYSYPFRNWPVNERERMLYSDISVADLTWRPAYEWLKDMNWKYNNNVMDREFYLRNDDAKAQAEFIAGRTGNFSFYMQYDVLADLMDALKANNPEAEVAVLPPSWNVPEGKAPQSRGYWDFGMIMGINRMASERQRIAIWMFLEWMSQRDVLFTLQNGHEGENYRLLPGRLPERIASYSGEARVSPNGNKDYWCLMVETADYSNPDISRAVSVALWSPPEYKYLEDDMIRYYHTSAPYRTRDALFTVPLKSVQEHGASLNALFQELYVNCVIVPPDRFETVYAEACRTYLAGGYQSVLDEKQRAIAAGNYVR